MNLDLCLSCCFYDKNIRKFCIIVLYVTGLAKLTEANITI